MANITIDDKEFQRKMTEIITVKIDDKKRQAVHDVASEILRLSSFEVPHDKGLLQNSGNVIDEDEQSIVGYNKVYASRLHEHPEYKFQKGRKGKYLENPIKQNMSIFIKYFQDALKGALS